MIRLTSAALLGLQALPIDVEVDATPGLHVFRIVGLPDKAVAESRERITAAIKNSGSKPPGSHNSRITVNLAPADIKKEGPAYDLPIAIGFLAATEQVRFDSSDKLFAGEVALDGSIRPIRGALAIAALAAEHGYRELFLPTDNAREAALISDIDVYPVPSLSALITHLEGRSLLNPATPPPVTKSATTTPGAFHHIRGQHFAKRALTIAAAGGHNALLVGPPGSGKTLLARAMTDLLPPMTRDEMLEVSTIFSVAGLLSDTKPVINKRPFQSPHHTASAVSIIGGGQHPTPGEVTMAHRGVLFLDELPEFRRDVLEGLRQPLEDGVVTITRSGGRATFPASFSLIASMNPCPCGFRGDEKKACTCTAGERARYERKISGPLLDRLDLHVTVPRVTHATLTSTPDDDGADIQQSTILEARNQQAQRFSGVSFATNAEMDVKTIKKFCKTETASERLLATHMEEHNLSARGYHRALKVARTIADLERQETIATDHILEALHYRRTDAIFA